MPKKSAQWVTIPEATLHTPVSEGAQAPKPKAKGSSPDFVKNKLFWGAGFVVVLVAAFAVMAPTQFGKLLQGNVLFDTSGVSGGDTAGFISPLNLLPQAAEPKKESEKTPDTVVAPAVDETLKPAAPEEVAEPVVKPQDKPMDVTVVPLAKPEPVVVTPLVTGPVDCASDTACLLPKLADCTLAKGVLAYEFMGQAVETNLEITGAEGENCLVKSVLAKFPVAEAVGKDALCKLPKGTYTKESLQAEFGDLSKLSAVCGGSAVDSLKAYSDSVIAEQGQADLVAQLKKQVEELQRQKEKEAQIAQDLINAAQQNAGGLHSAAPANGVGNGLPTGTAGQANTLQPGFRENPYRVTVTPEQMLSQRLAGGTTFATGTGTYSNSATQYSGGSPVTQQANFQGSKGSNGQNSASVTLVKGANTPQTGPEATAIALFASFAALVFWKAKKVFA